jgi:hypothetical protein
MKYLAAAVVIGSGIVLSACIGSSTTSNNSDTSTTSTGSAPAADQKTGTTVKTGIISQAGGKYFLQEAGGTPQMIESYAVELSQYVGQTVTVTGQYSGDTLFVGSIE